MSKNTKNATKKPYQRISKKTDDDVQFSKQVPVPPRDKLARQTKDSIKFVKQVPVHPRETLKRKIKLDSYSHLNKKSKNDDVTFIKQVPLHPRERMERLEKINDKVNFVKEVPNVKPKILAKTKRNTDKMKIINRKTKATNENTRNVMRGELNFDPKEILNKTLIFDTSMVDEEVIIDRIIDTINNPFNDKYWREHKPGTNYFTLRLENGK